MVHVEELYPPQAYRLLADKLDPPKGRVANLLGVAQLLIRLQFQFNIQYA